MSHSVSLTDDAAADLEELIEYIGAHDSAASADRVLDQIEKALSSLSRNPERGAYPGELSAIGVREYREVYFKPYRIIYRVIGNEVLVLLIADGRRDMQSSLERRLIEGRP
ncbi:MAG: type II toxin-antitoxin system RelE/ParE family toxin [Gammaproteobacteria bacterium]|nr:type II toxin-antitoxin system RelE/ParE family toxin [Gammaproteobacteria bacterium]